MSHLNPVNAPKPTPTLTETHITTPSDKQAVASLESQSIVLLQSIHDELTSSSQLLNQPEQERGEGLALEEKHQQANEADDNDDKDTSL
jgi:hypothetical protein